jgi:ABC-type dipeptide/oligopeptide/nickel transport system permease component
MISYIIRRLLQILPTVFVALSALFFIFFMLPGDPARLIASGQNEQVRPEVLERVTERYGLDEPILTQFVDYWKRTLQWDLGRSFQNDRSVNEILGDRAVASLRLGIWAIIIEVVVGISVGLISALRRYSTADRMTTIVTAAAAAIPAFVLGLMLQYFFAVLPGPNKWDWPEWMQLEVLATRMPDTWTLFFIPTGDQWRFTLLPAITLAAVTTALLTRMMRGSMLEVLRADYMRTAKAKGLSEAQIVRKHGMRNAMLPVVTLLGIDFATAVGVAVLTETTFSWPGLGSEIVEAVSSRDLPVVLGLTLPVVLVYALINLVVDVSYAWFDPRIRLGEESAV